MMRSVSVIIPTYNRAHLLPETLDAVLAQTSPALEVIVVDDGSTDDTAEVVARYAPRVTYMRIPNGGELAARNSALAVARGDLVAFCDSDDIWQPDFIATMQALWARTPALRTAFANFRILRDGVLLPRDKFADAPPGYWDGMRDLGDDLAVFEAPIVDRLVQFQPFFPSCFVAERGFLQGLGGWDASLGRIVSTDFVTILLLGEYPPFGVVRRPLVGIRKHGDNYSGDVQKMNLGDAQVLEHVLATRPTLRPLAAQITASIAARRAAALDTAFARRDYAAVRAIYRLLPASHHGALRRVKHAVASLPRPVGQVAGAALLRLGSLRGVARG
ncbi:glycosyltransferase [Roseomonas frigidaquae]|uniref:Glycosyltransferase n=1 Tax=Falsiroseomonas frigidaquae TaxID=487318 RepID=A0ABX1EZF4_9PROT|nr:glycosyltransferase family 2 protein [Falsiroseomonas frigidaquae]NKE45433.1 glycosyltransferase [Falsiroseomonas frigidaquae]